MESPNQNQIQIQKISTFDQCLDFFGINNVEYYQLSDSEQMLFGVCHKIFRVGRFDADDPSYALLDEKNRMKLGILIGQLLDEF
ncbi:hypothetical protein ARV1_gp37 [Acidianus rod-shaped virus 1]|uniref:Uncharacterized protein n=1 Tax=Acidianus rod-shaped virus 1 TaxID=309181 RepID=Q50I34_9VIRU|nr:hypothetical protein ARV1_gp37 [Acidianus rod-shaped virus 1]CAI44192.1 hypothetical protein [Acidianus rod-shaped virus 1]